MEEDEDEQESVCSENICFSCDFHDEQPLENCDEGDGAYVA